MQPEQLQLEIERFFALGADAVGDADAESAFVELRDALNEGKVRAAEPSLESPTSWRVTPIGTAHPPAATNATDPGVPSTSSCR